MARLKASTLLESMVSMVILSVTFSIATLVYTNILAGTGKVQRMKAYIKAENLAQRTRKEKRYLDEIIKDGDFTLSKSVAKYKNYSNLYELNIKVNLQNKDIAEHREIIFSE